MISLAFGLVSGMVIGGTGGYLGSLMLSRRMALVAGPLGHLTLPGVALALLWGFDVSVGAFPFVLLGSLLIWLLELKTRLPTEALTALVFSSGVAVAFLFLPVDRAEAALVGDITAVGPLDTALSVVACVLVGCAVKVAYPKLILGNVSEELAAAEGIDVRRYNLLYLFSIAVIVALGVKVVGGLLTAAFVAIPASAARNVSDNLTRYKRVAVGVGVVSAGAGILLGKVTSMPAGPLVVLVSAAAFLATLPFARARSGAP